MLFIEQPHGSFVGDRGSNKVEKIQDTEGQNRILPFHYLDAAVRWDCRKFVILFPFANRIAQTIPPDEDPINSDGIWDSGRFSARCGPAMPEHLSRREKKQHL